MYDLVEYFATNSTEECASPFRFYTKNEILLIRYHRETATLEEREQGVLDVEEDSGGEEEQEVERPQEIIYEDTLSPAEVCLVSV